MTNDIHPAYRPCVGVMLINRDGLVFIGKRKKERGKALPSHPWQMPQGGIDDGEAPQAAALRELHEETNVRSVSVLAETAGWHRYDIPQTYGPKARVWRGQTQKWFALRFDGPEEEIDVLRPGNGRHRAEFSEWRWVKAFELPALVVPFKRDVYVHVLGEFAPFVAA